MACATARRISSKIDHLVEHWNFTARIPGTQAGASTCDPNQRRATL